jgi:flagellar biosynthetic protein FliQ
VDQSQISAVITDAVLTILTVAAPMLLVGLVAGLIISILQATTQINEQTIVFVTKILSVFITLILFGSWMLQRLQEFTMRIFDMWTGL